MKVAQLTCVWPPYGGGIGKVAFEYSKILSANHQVTVFTPRYNKNQPIIKLTGVQVELLPSIIKIGNAAFLPQLISKLKTFDIVHLHYPFFGVQELLALGRYPKMIVSYHMVPRATGLKGWLFNTDCQWTEKKLASKVITWIVSSTDYAESIVKPRLGNSSVIKILPFGISDKFIPRAKSMTLLQKLNIKKNTPVLLFVGGLDKAHYFKGIETLIKALTQLSSKNYKFIIVGEGNLKNHYKGLAKKLGVDSQIIFSGYVSDDELPNYYCLADVFVLPSLNQAEAFGLAAGEAMACGLPVIASNLAGVRSLVKNGETGLLVEPGNIKALAQAISNLLANLSQAKRLGQNATKQVNNEYRWPAIGKKLLEIYSLL
ncbi:MAG: glycosyltransferase family 4 protein [Patescibacteria group bacterium]